MKNKLLNKKRLTQLFSLFTFLVLFVTTAKAQFNTGTITIDGTGGEAAYTSAVSGNGTNVKMAWDDTYLYIYYSAGVAAEPFNIFIDTDPSIPVATGGNGAAAGAINWGITPTLPIKADFQIYWTGSFAEYRTVSGGVFVFTATPFNNTNDSYSNTGITNRELRVRWTTMGLSGRPAAFNWLGYANSTASFIFNQVPDENPSGGSSPQSPVNNYYYTVSTTASTGTTNPFSRKSYESRATTTMGLAATTLWDYTLDASGATTHTFTPTGTITVNNALLIATNNTFLVGTGGVRTLQFGSTSTDTPSLTCNGTLTPNNGSGNDLSIIAASGTTTIAGSAANTAYRIFDLTVNNGATVQAPNSGTVDLGAQFGTITVAGALNFVNGSGVVNLTNNGGATASNLTINVTSTGTATFNNVTSSGASPSSITLANVDTNGAAKLSFNDVTNNANNTIISSSGGIANTAVPITIRGNLTNAGTFTTLSTSNSRNLAITVTGGASILSSNTNITYRTLTIANTGSTASNSTGVTLSGAGTTITFNDGRIVTVSSGARLIVDPVMSPTITIGGSGAGQVQVNGFFRRSAGGTLTNFGTATVFFNNGGTYEHNFTTAAGVIPTATWNIGSTCAIIGYTTFGLVPTSLGQSFGNFTWNCPSGTAGNTNFLGALSTVNGNFSVLSTGASTLIYTNTGTQTLSIGGDFTIAGTSVFALNYGAASVPTFNIAGNFSMSSSGGFNLSNSTGASNLNIGGNFIQTAGTINRPGTGVASINFIKSTGIQTFTQSGGTMVNAFAMNVGNGTTTNTLQFLTNANLGGSPFTFNVLNNATVDFQTFQLTGSSATNAFSSAAGATLVSANTTGTGAFRGNAVTTGSVATAGTKTYDAGTNYTFNGAAVQVAGASLVSAANLTINNTSGVTLSANTEVSGTLTLPSSNTLTLGGFNLTVSAAGDNTVAGIIAGTGSLVKTGLGVLTLSAASGNSTANTYTAGTTVNGVGTGTISVTGLTNITAATITSAAQSVTFSTATPANGTYRLLPGALTVGTESFSHNADDTKIVTFNYANSTITVTSPSTGDYRSKASGDWTTLATWERWNGTVWIEPTVGQGYPLQNASVTRLDILNSHNVTCGIGTGSNYVSRLAITAGANNTSLTFTSTSYFQLSGTSAIVLSSTGAGNALLDFGNANIYSFNQLQMGIPSSTGTCKVIINNGKLNIGANIVMFGSAAQNSIEFSGSGTLTSSGGTISGGAIVAGTGTVQYTDTGAQNVGAYAFHNLILSGSGIKTFNAATTISRSLTISGTAISGLPNAANYTIPSLMYGTGGQVAGTYGSTASGATLANRNDTYYNVATTGIITVTSNLPFVNPNVATAYIYNGLPQGSTPTNSGTGTSYIYSYTNNGGSAYSSSSAPTNVGSYFVTVTVAADGVWGTNSSAVTGYSIVPRTLTITANNATKIFGETHTTGSGSTLFTSSGIQNSQTIGTVTITSAGAASGAVAGTYSIIPSAATGGTFTATNYTISYVNGTLTVLNPAIGDYRTVASGNWSVLATWERWDGTAWVTPSAITPEGYPSQFTAGPNVYIRDGHTIVCNVSINQTMRPTYLEMSAGTGTSSLSFSGGGTVNFNTVRIYPSTATGASRSINIPTGYIAIPTIVIENTGNDAIDSEITIGTGTLYSFTSITMNGTSNRNAIRFTGSGLLDMVGSGSCLTGGAIIPSSGTVQYSRPGVQTVGAYNFNNLTLSGAGAGPFIKTINGATTIATNLTISGSASASLNIGTTYNIGTLTLGCLGRENGSWGSSGPDPDPTYPDDTYFQNTTGFINVATNTRPIPVTTQTQPTCVAGGIITVTPVGATSYTVSGTSPVVAAVTNASGVFSGLAAGTYSAFFTNPCGTSTTVTTITISGLVTNTWNGTAWSLVSNPTADQNIVFSGNYPPTPDPNVDITACSCQVTSGVLDINAGRTLTITNGLTVSGGSMFFKNNSSLVQVKNVANSGNITYERSIAPSIRDTDYTYWSSPVVGFTLGNVYNNNPMSLFYSYGVIAGVEDWKQESTATVMSPGKGYIINGAPKAVFPSPPPSAPVFIGVPNNGDYSITGVVANKSYLLGNPYPSAIDADIFLNANSGVLNGTLYFWTHNTEIGTGTTNLGTGALAYTSNDYATYNATGGVAATQPDIDPLTGLPYQGQAPSGGLIPNGKIAAGQGFFGSSLVFPLATSVIFKNDMRIAGNNSQFFKKRNSKTGIVIEKNRLWLNLTNTQGAFKQTLVGYITDATNEYDNAFDGESIDGNEFVDFYSVNRDKNLVIQGRALPFDEIDEVPLGYRTTINGDFTMKIDQVDGFLTNQAVFVEDRLTNTIYDLKSGNYTFNTEAGTFNNRFVLKFTNKTLSLEEVETNDRINVLYSNNLKSLIIRNYAIDVTVNSVNLYNISGQKIANWDVKDKEQTNIQIPINNLPSEIYIVKVKTNQGESSKKIIIK